MMVAALRPGAGVIVDGSAVTYMSAAGVRVLATRPASGRGAGRAHRLLPLQRRGGRLLLVSGFSQLFDVADTRRGGHGETAPQIRWVTLRTACTRAALRVNYCRAEARSWNG